MSDLRSLLAQLHPVGAEFVSLLADTLSSASTDPLTTIRQFQEANAVRPRFIPFVEAPLSLLTVLNVDRTEAHTHLLQGLSNRFVELVAGIDVPTSTVAVLSEPLAQSLPFASAAQVAKSASTAAAAAAASKRKRDRKPSATAASSASSASSATFGNRTNPKIAGVLRQRKKLAAAAQRRKEREAAAAAAANTSSATTAMGQTDAGTIASVPVHSVGDGSLKVKVKVNVNMLQSQSQPSTEQLVIENEAETEDSSSISGAIHEKHVKNTAVEGKQEPTGSAIVNHKGPPVKQEDDDDVVADVSSSSSLAVSSSAPSTSEDEDEAAEVEAAMAGSEEDEEEDGDWSDSEMAKSKSKRRRLSDAGTVNRRSSSRPQRRTAKDVDRRASNILRIPKREKALAKFRLDPETKAPVLAATEQPGFVAAAGDDPGFALAALLDSDDDHGDSDIKPESLAISISKRAVASTSTQSQQQQQQPSITVNPDTGIPELSQVYGEQLLSRLLSVTFQYLDFPELQPAAMAVLAKHPSVPPAYLDALAANPSLYQSTPVQVRRQIWIHHPETFREELEPLMAGYMDACQRDQNPSELCPAAGDLVSLEPNPRDRRKQMEVLAQLADNIGVSLPLYAMLLSELREAFMAGGDPVFCALRHDLLMLIHDRNQSEIYEMDHCHSFSWCLDASLTDGHFTDRRLDDLESYLKDSKFKKPVIIADMCMVARAPQIFHVLIRATFTALVNVVEDEAIPAQSNRLLLLCKLVGLATSSHNDVKKKIPQLSDSFVQAFLPLLASRILSDALRDLEPGTPPEPIDSGLNPWLSKSPISRQILLYYVLTRIRAIDLEGIQLLLPWLLEHLGADALILEHDFANSVVNLLLANNSPLSPSFPKLRTFVLDRFLLVVIRQADSSLDRYFHWHFQFVRFVELSLQQQTLSMDDLCEYLRKALIGGLPTDSASLRPGEPLSPDESAAVFDAYNSIYAIIHPYLAAGGEIVQSRFDFFIEYISQGQQ